MSVAAADGGLVVNINGKLNFAAVPTLNKDNRNIILKNSRVIFNLSGVTFSDNAGMALLVALASFAKSVHKEILFTDLPEQLLDLIDAVGIRKFLPIS
jgi:anti-anti-sigma factor